MTPEQMIQLIDNIPRLKIRKWLDQDVAMLFKLCYWLNLRITEALKLEAEHFDLSSNEVYLGKTKNDKEAYAAIFKQFMPELSIWLDKKKGPLFPGMSRFIVYNWLIRSGEMLKITALTESTFKTGEKTKCHIFRKSMAKDMLYGNNGIRKAPLNVVSKHLRHKGRNALSSTQEYLKLNLEDVKDYMNETIPDKDQIIID